MVMKNPLDILFKDLIRDMAQKERESVLERQSRPKQSTYANPLNWRLGRVIELIHRDEGSLGNFQEYHHKLSPSARRLLPAAPGLSATTTELVWGEFWIHPKFQAPVADPESDAEVRAIWQRFNELMALEPDEEDA